MIPTGTWRLLLLLATTVLWGGFTGAAQAQATPPSDRGTPPGSIAPGSTPPGGAPGQILPDDAVPGYALPNPAQMGPPPFLLDADTPFERPVQTIDAGPLFGGQPASATAGRGENLNSGPAAMGRALLKYKEMTELPAGIGFIGGAGIKPKPPGRAARAGGPANGNARGPAAQNVPPPPAGILDQPGITLVLPLSSNGPGGD